MRIADGGNEMDNIANNILEVKTRYDEDLERIRKQTKVIIRDINAKTDAINFNDCMSNERTQYKNKIADVTK